MTLPAILVGKNLGETVARVITALLVLAVLGMLGFSLLSGEFYEWRAGVWKDRAVDAAAAAETAAANAVSSEKGAANASETRANMDSGTLTIRLETENAAARLEDYAKHPDPVVGLSPVADDVVRELEAAESRARDAANRLQRADSR